MADTHHIVITPKALSELEGIAKYIRSHSEQNAPLVAERIVDAIDGLGFMPARYKRVGKSRKRGLPVHALVVRPFTIYYSVDERPPAVFILRIVHGARRQPKLFD